MVSNFFTDAGVVVVVLGFMIFIHELGHFMAAKWFGVRVLTFSLGFGKRLFGFKRRFSFGAPADDEQESGRNCTDYRVSLLPFGGYVKMAGEDPSEAQQGDEGEFLGRPRWQRFVIAIMGPSMNLLLAVALMAGLYRFHYEKAAYEEQPVLLGQVEPDSPAARAGIQPGDLIVRLGSLRNPTWEDVVPKILMSPDEAIPVEVMRNGQHLNLTITPQAKGRDEVGYVGWAPDAPPLVGAVEPSLPAGQAGLKVGDRIVAFDGKKSPDSAVIVRGLQAGKGKAVDFTVQRGGKEIHFQVQPVYGSAMGDGEKKWRIGVAFREDIVVRQLPLGQALAASVDFNVRRALETFDLLGKLLTRRMSARSIAGPIGIAQLSGEYYRAGVMILLPVVAYISLQLAVFNLLPIPILDGGMILLLLIEGLMRRDLSLRVKERVAQVGMAFLLLLAAFVTYNDLIKTFRPY